MAWSLDQMLENPEELGRQLAINAAKLQILDRPRLSGEYARAILVDGRPRRYELHVPLSYRRVAPSPLVLNLHGGGGRAGIARIQTRLDATADAHGFIVAHLDGTGVDPSRVLTWNAGICCGYAVEHGVDDVAYVSAALDDIDRFFNVDHDRIYATGHSNGAMMAHRLGCALSDRIAAIAPVGAAIGLTCTGPAHPVSVLHIHGLADESAPFAGGVGPHSISEVAMTPVSESMQMWAAWNRCAPEPVEKLQDGIVTATTYRSAAGAEVRLMAIEGMGHTWPGGVQIAKESFAGWQPPAPSASDLMWEFFKRHRRWETF